MLRGTLKQSKPGFNLIELLIVIAIIAILSVLVTVGLTKAKQRAKISRVTVELQDIAKAVTQYAEDNNYQYPGDVDRAVPPGLEKYLSGGTWPVSIWPHGVFDWDSWTTTSGTTTQQILQISYRLCDLNDPESYCSDPIIFPHFTRQSSIFYCISGSCLPHRDYPSAPGYCVNCKVKEVNPPL